MNIVIVLCLGVKCEDDIWFGFLLDVVDILVFLVFVIECFCVCFVM